MKPSILPSLVSIKVFSKHFPKLKHTKINKEILITIEDDIFCLYLFFAPKNSLKAIERQTEYIKQFFCRLVRVPRFLLTEVLRNRKEYVFKFLLETTFLNGVKTKHFQNL